MAGSDAWRVSDGGGDVIVPAVEADDWTPMHIPEPAQPDWDSHSANDEEHSIRSMSPSHPPPGDDAFTAPRLVDDHRNSLHSEGSDVEDEAFLQNSKS